MSVVLNIKFKVQKILTRAEPAGKEHHTATLIHFFIILYCIVADHYRKP